MPVTPGVRALMVQPGNHVRSPRRDLLVAPGTDVGLARGTATDRLHDVISLAPPAGVAGAERTHFFGAASIAAGHAPRVVGRLLGAVALDASLSLARLRRNGTTHRSHSEPL